MNVCRNTWTLCPFPPGLCALLPTSKMESPFFPHVRKPCVIHILIILFGDWLDVLFLTADIWFTEIPHNNFITITTTDVATKCCRYTASFIFSTARKLVHFTDFETHLSRPDAPSHSQVSLHTVESCSHPRSSWTIKRLHSNQQ